MSEAHRALVERLYEGFNGRDEACIVEVCDAEMEFFPMITAGAVGRDAPYKGPAGLRDYFDDVGRVWEELRISPGETESRGDIVLVRGRVYARSRDLGIRDLSIAWVWEIREGRFVRGEVFPDPEQALTRFSAQPPTPA